MFKVAKITEEQKNILEGKMFKENSKFSPFELNGNHYITEIEVIENINNDVEWVNYLPLINYKSVAWHEDKAVQIIQNKTGVVWGAMNEPEIAMALAMHRKTTNMATYEEGEKLYFYANTILPEHQAIFEAYPNLEITVNHAEN